MAKEWLRQKKAELYLHRIFGERYIDKKRQKEKGDGFLSEGLG